MWHVQDQEEGKGEEKHPVPCKKCEWMPWEDKKTKEVHFKPTTPYLRVNLGEGVKFNPLTDHYITWRPDKATDENPHPDPLQGKFIYHWPATMEYHRLKVGKLAAKRRFGPVFDTLSPKEVKKPGETKAIESHERFWAWEWEFAPQCVRHLLPLMKPLFEGRIIELAQERVDKAEKAKEKAKIVKVKKPRRKAA